ncbi:MAG: undecaprenyl-diphosphate phosphatase [Actinomycetota bacterium]|nr:undecaprenyl-diphosphate phosphatase [Actinomycetota bacterium]
MNVLEAILLGVVQGLTEFLPISSSGHLILVPWLADIRYLQDHPDFNKTFDVALHLGTLFGVIAYFRAEVDMMLRGLGGLARRRAVTNANERLALIVAVATIPAVIVGGLGEDWIDEHLGEPWQIAILLALFGLLLAWADRLPQRHGMEAVGPKQALQIGVAQAAALAPGVSRSGVTITAGRVLGLDRDAAARFSFLLLIPAVGGAVVLKGVGVIQDGLPAGAAGPMAAGVAAAAVSSYVAIAWMLAYVRRRSYDVFVVYRLIAAAIVLLLIATGVKAATF